MLQANQIVRMLTKFRVVSKCAHCTAHYECSYYDAKKSRLGHLCPLCSNKLASLKTFTQADLLEVLDYNEATGALTHKLPTQHKNIGDVAGYAHHEGYLSILIGGKEYLVHRVIWFMKTGHWPDQIDHEDHDRSNNAWHNLNDVPSRKNQMNMSQKKSNTSGHTGVRVLPSGKYCAYVMVNRKQISLGSYDDEADAVSARKKGEAQYGFHVNHGR